MSFVPPQQAQRIHQLAFATELLTQTAAQEVASSKSTEQQALVIGMMCHLSRQLQVLLECMSGVTPTRTAANITVVEPEPTAN